MSPIIARLSRVLALWLCLGFMTTAYADPIVIKDIADREVTLPKPAERVILADSRILQALQILNPQAPFKKVIAWDNSLKSKAPELLDLYGKKYPELLKLPQLENPFMSDFSVERAVVLKPDLIIFDVGVLEKMKSSGALAQLSAVGIPVVFIDFRLNPLLHSAPSILLLGKALGEEKNATAFVDFYQQRLATIRERVATLKTEQRPSVFIERHAGMTGDECCFTFGKGSFGQFIEEAGGTNIGAHLFAKTGVINLEQVITSNPDVYMVTGTDWSYQFKQTVAVPLGYNADEKLAHKQLNYLMSRKGLNVLNAVKQKKVFAVYHQFYDSPLNVLAVEAMAKFLHPSLFSDLDPAQDSLTIHHQFLMMPEPGLFWVSAQ